MSYSLPIGATTISETNTYASTASRGPMASERSTPRRAGTDGWIRAAAGAPCALPTPGFRCCSCSPIRSSCAAQRGGGASQASGSHYDGRGTERHYDYDDTSDLIYDDDALDDFDRDEDAYDRDDGRDGFDPYDDIDEMTCHMEDPDDPFL